MTTETRLREAMADAVAPALPDPDQLVTIARRRGLGIRRRRQALGTVGVAAAIALAALAPTVIAGDRGTEATVTHSLSVGSVEQAFDPHQTSPITGRSTAAALMYAVGLEASGTATDVRGQGDGKGVDGGIVMTYGVFAFTPGGSSTAGEVAVNVQYLPPETQAKGDDVRALTCHDGMEDCHVTQLADGSSLRTSVQHSEHNAHTGTMLVADLHRADHVRVVATASNGSDITERDEKVTRDDPVLTTAQLVAVVTQPWWGAELPMYFAQQGDLLKPYDEVGGAADATPSSSPTP